MAFLTGASGVIYRQFSITIVSAMVLSVIVAIVVTPALCATLLKPVKKVQHHSNAGFFRWFNQKFDRANKRYQALVLRIITRPGPLHSDLSGARLTDGAAVLSPADCLPSG